MFIGLRKDSTPGDSAYKNDQITILQIENQKTINKSIHKKNNNFWMFKQKINWQYLYHIYTPDLAAFFLNPKYTLSIIKIFLSIY